MKDALLEIGVEHLPARFVAPALAQLEAKALELLRENRLTVSGVEAHGTLRRLALIVRGVRDESESLERIISGPPARLWKDEEGAFTPQSAGFARNQGVRPEDLEIVKTPKGEFLQARKTVAGEPAAVVLARVFPALITALDFPKMMEWEPSRLRFARPIRGLLAIHGGKAVAFAAAGVRSGNKALGASLGSKPIPIELPGDYVKTLRDNCVLVRVEDRRKALSQALDQATANVDGRLDKDPALLEEIVYLTEHPTPVVGDFGQDFLKLPQVFLTTVLKKQLKFFPMLAGKESLAPHFVGVRDGISEGQKEVQNGYERVLEARFSDARFFYQRDLQSRLRNKQDRLKGVSFHKLLGTMYEKRERGVELAIWLCASLWRRDVIPNLGVVEAIARLAYADLVTDVVREFPELQAAMGGHYARIDGEGERVALGVEEFYFPLSAKSSIPTHLEGAVASLAGKMDTLAAMLLVGLKPTGSEDPFALRRAGMGVIRIILEHQLPVNIPQFARKALALAHGHAKPQEAPSVAEFLRGLQEFLWQRAENVFLERGYSQDEVQSVEEGGLEDLVRTFKRLAAVHALRPNPEFLQLASAFKRASNILKQAGIMPGVSGASDSGGNAGLGDGAEVPGPAGAAGGNVQPLFIVNRSLISQEAEATLFDAMNRVEKTVLERIARDDYESGLRRLVELKPCVDRFFETVRVMDASDHVKRNRLALLATLVRLFKSVADISRIQSSN